jgi:hypothetical protein
MRRCLSWPCGVGAGRRSGLLFLLGHLGCLAYLRTRANFRPVKTARLGRPWPRYWRDVPYPVPTVSARPSPALLLAPGSTAFHQPLTKLTCVISPCPQGGAAAASGSGSALLVPDARTGNRGDEDADRPGSCPSCGTSFPFDRSCGSALVHAAETGQGGAAPLAHGGTWLALLAPDSVSAFSFFFFRLFHWRPRLPDRPVLPDHRARVPRFPAAG